MSCRGKAKTGELAPRFGKINDQSKYPPRSEWVCAHCGTHFFTRRPSHQHRYCSRRCHDDARRGAFPQVGRQGAYYRLWRKTVLERDAHQCRRCHATEHLHAHHKKRWKDHPELRYDVDNGITLCQGCHWKAHHRRPPQ
jgi:5-methylcytosine-specific restriction endonuclease McrA